MAKFPENSNMEFAIALPERFRLGDWQVCLKSLIMPSRAGMCMMRQDLHGCFKLIQF